jgi:hypothetical protein
VHPSEANFVPELRANANGKGSAPGAIPPSTPSPAPQDTRRSFKRVESRVGVKADEAAQPSPRMQAIFIFRIAPPPAAAAPPLTPAGPPSVDKAKQ